MLNKYDYYYGAFLSKLVSMQIVPALIEESKERRVYQLETGSNRMKVYSKYATSSTNTWNFRFSEEERERLLQWSDEERHQLFVLICSKKDLLGGEIAILTFDQLLACMDVREKYKEASCRVAIRKKKHSPFLYAYGTSRSLDDALPLTRNFADLLLHTSIPEPV